MARPRFLVEAPDDLILDGAVTKKIISTKDFSTAHALTGTIDGVNKVFHLPQSPGLLGFILIVDGEVQRPGADFVFSDTTVVTFAVAPLVTTVSIWAFM